MTAKLRRFHAAKWDEPVVMELGRPGARGQIFPALTAYLLIRHCTVRAQADQNTDGGMGDARLGEFFVNNGNHPVKRSMTRIVVGDD